MATASNKIYDFIKAYEKFKDKLYDDDANNATIGYGHLVHYGKVGTNKLAEKEFEKGITEAKALELLQVDVKTKAENYINIYVKEPLNQNQYDALVSFTYNVGAGNFSSSTLLKKVNSKDPKEKDAETITTCFKQWNKGTVNGVLTVFGGLTIRRQQEADIYNKNSYVSIH